MKTNFAKTTVSTVVLALAALGAASSFAATNDASAGKTRAEVRAEYFQALKDGQIESRTEGATLVAPATTSTKTRAEVQAEYFQALKDGQIESRTEGATVSAKSAASNVSREDIRAQARMAAHLPKDLV